MVRKVVLRVLEDSSYRQAAERIRDEIAALAGPQHAIMLLERLASPRRGGVEPGSIGSPLDRSRQRLG